MRWGCPLFAVGVYPWEVRRGYPPHGILGVGDPFPSKKCLRIAHPGGVIKNALDPPWVLYFLGCGDLGVFCTGGSRAYFLDTMWGGGDPFPPKVPPDCIFVPKKCNP